MNKFDPKKLKILKLKQVNFPIGIFTDYTTKLNLILKNGLILNDKEKEKLTEINIAFKECMDIANPQGLDLSVLPKNYLIDYIKGELILSVLQKKDFSTMQEQYLKLKELTSDFEADSLASLAMVELYREESSKELFNQ